MPGATTWQDVDVFLQHLGVAPRPQNLKNGSIYHGTRGFDFDLHDYIIVNNIGFLESDNIVELIYAGSDGYSNPIAFQDQWASFSPKRILEEYGVPSRLLISSNSGGYVTENRQAGYRLWLFYDHLGFVVMYSGSGDYGPTFHFCPRFENGEDIQHLEMYLQSPDNPSPIEKTAEIIGMEIDPYPHIQTLEQAAMITPSEFYELMLHGEPACFDTPQDIWP